GPQLASLWSQAKAFLAKADARQRESHGGRAPDFGDPAAIVATLDGMVTARLATFGELDHARAAVDLGDSGVTMRATLTPSEGKGPARQWVDAMHVGDASPLLSLPSASQIAFAMRDSEGSRAQQAADLERAVVSALGERLKSPQAVHAAIEDFT